MLQAESLPVHPMHLWDPMRMWAAIVRFHQMYQLEVEAITLKRLGVGLKGGEIDTPAWDAITLEKAVVFTLGLCDVPNGLKDYRQFVLKDVRVATISEVLGETDKGLIKQMAERRWSFCHVTVVVDEDLRRLSVASVQSCMVDEASLACHALFIGGGDVDLLRDAMVKRRGARC
jgi:hypothetical protein